MCCIGRLGRRAGRQGAYWLLLEGGFGSRFAWSETLTRATPLMLTGLAVAVAFRTRLFNIGAEGQLYLGALAAVAVGGQVDGAAAPWAATLPNGLLFGLMVAAGMLAGALLLLVPALLKQRLGVDEVVTTLLLNFIVLLGVSMMLDGPMKDPLAMGWPQSVALVPELELSRQLERSRVHSGLLMRRGAGRDPVGGQPLHGVRPPDARGGRQRARGGLRGHAGARA